MVGACRKGLFWKLENLTPSLAAWFLRDLAFWNLGSEACLRPLPSHISGVFRVGLLPKFADIQTSSLAAFIHFPDPSQLGDLSRPLGLLYARTDEGPHL